MTYNDSFQDRITNAAKAREKALAKLRAKAPMDEKTVAERVERQAAREARATEKKVLRAAEVAGKAAKAAAAAPPSEEERKAARVAKYAARKARR